MATDSTASAQDGFVFFTDSAISEKIQDVAKQELGETEEMKKECLQMMKMLIKEHKIVCITRDEFLLRFLRTKKFHVERSFEALQNYAHQRVAFHKRLLKLRPEVVEKCLRLNILGFLPYCDADERLIFFFTTDAWNPGVCSDEDIAMVIILLTSYAAEKPSSQVSGVVALFDNSTIPLHHAPYLLRRANFVRNFLFNGLPIRYREMHSINENFVIKYVLRILDPFVPKKIKRRIRLHGKTREVIFQHLPPSILPDTYGGTLGPLNNDHLVEVILTYLQKMKEEQRHFLQPNL